MEPHVCDSLGQGLLALNRPSLKQKAVIMEAGLCKCRWYHGNEWQKQNPDLNPDRPSSGHVVVTVLLAHLLLSSIQRLLDTFCEESGSGLEVRPDLVLSHGPRPLDLSRRPASPPLPACLACLLSFLSNPPGC